MSLPTIHAEAAPVRGEVVLHRTWPSRLDRKQEVLDTIAKELLRRGWVAEDDAHWLALVLDEVIVNAMLHGNEGDPDLDIEVTLSRDDGAWILAVSDRGQGFLSDDLPDPEDPDGLLAEHGRGIRLMHEWLDELAYWRGGATAVLSRHIPVPAG